MRARFPLFDALFLLGAILGAAFGMTFAQRSGRQLRRKLSEAKDHGGGSAIRSVLADEGKAISDELLALFADLAEKLDDLVPEAEAPAPAETTKPAVKKAPRRARPTGAKARKPVRKSAKKLAEDA